VALHTTARNAGGTIKLANLTKRVGDLLQVTKLLTVFDVYNSEAEALDSFRKGRRLSPSPRVRHPLPHAVRSRMASRLVFLLGLLISASSFVSPAVALTTGLVFGLLFSHPYDRQAKNTPSFFYRPPWWDSASA